MDGCTELPIIPQGFEKAQNSSKLTFTVPGRALVNNLFCFAVISILWSLGGFVIQSASASYMAGFSCCTSPRIVHDELPPYLSGHPEVDLLSSLPPGLISDATIACGIFSSPTQHLDPAKRTISRLESCSINQLTYQNISDHQLRQSSLRACCIQARLSNLLSAIFRSTQ